MFTIRIWIVYDCFAHISLTVNISPILCTANALLYWFPHYHLTAQSQNIPVSEWSQQCDGIDLDLYHIITYNMYTYIIIYIYIHMLCGVSQHGGSPRPCISILSHGHPWLGWELGVPPMTKRTPPYNYMNGLPPGKPLHNNWKSPCYY